jgi:ribose transport system substrate-binding protein
MHRTIGGIATSCVATLAVALALAGCSSSSGSADTSGTDQRAVTDAQAAVATLLRPVEPVELDLEPIENLPDLAGRTVLIVPSHKVIFGTQAQAITNVLTGLGVETTICDGQGNPTQMTSCMQQANTLRAVGVVTIAIPYKTVPNAYDALAKAGIPVVGSFQGTEGAPSNDRRAFMGISDYLTGGSIAAANYVIANSQGEAHVYWLGTTDSQAGLENTDLVRKHYSAHCPGCTFDGKGVATSQLAQIPTLVSTKMIQDPSIDWVHALNLNSTADGITTGLRNASRTGVSMGGFASGVVGVQGVEDGKFRFCVTSSADLLGYDTTDALFRVIAGQRLPSEYPYTYRIFDASNIDSITISPEAVLTNDWFGDTSYRDQYKKLWGLG